MLGQSVLDGVEKCSRDSFAVINGRGVGCIPLKEWLFEEYLTIC